MLSSEPLELLGKPIFGFFGLRDHQGQILPKLILGLCQRHDIDWYVLVLSLEHLVLGNGHTLRQLNNLFCELFHELLDLSYFGVCE